MAKIMVVDDDDLILEAIAETLSVKNYVVEKVHDGREAADRLKLYPYDLVILDINLPFMSGLEVCRAHRSGGGTVPILMLTTKDTVPEKIEGLESGADDYLPKPFDMAELLARVRSLLRRPGGYVDESLEMRGVTLDSRTGEVFRGEKKIELLAMEYKLLEFLMRNKDTIFSAEDLLNRVWSAESDSTVDAVWQCITRIRKKVDVGDAPSIITTVKGLGYKVESK